MYSQYYSFKSRAIALRKRGKTYGEIRKAIGKPIPKSTLSNWFRGIILTKSQQERISGKIFANVLRIQAKAVLANRARRKQYMEEIHVRVRHLSRELQKPDSARIGLALLYLGEGFKTTRGLVGFANSNPAVIRLFLRLLHICYDMDSTKLRATVQCRADQDIQKLERFWQRVTGIPYSQFYKGQIDPRTIGIPTKKVGYKGVCRINYLCADVFNELEEINRILCAGP